APTYRHRSRIRYRSFTRPPFRPITKAISTRGRMTSMTMVLDPKTQTSSSGNSNHNGNGQHRLRLLDLSHVTPEKGVQRLIERALEVRASDVFLVTNEQHVAVQVRLRGSVEQLCILDKDQGRRYIAHIRHTAGMDVSDFRKPHDGRWIYESPDRGGDVDLRINV